MGGLDLLLDRADLALDLLLRAVLLVELREVRVLVKRVREEAGFEDLDFLRRQPGNQRGSEARKERREKRTLSSFLNASSLIPMFSTGSRSATPLGNRRWTS